MFTPNPKRISWTMQGATMALLIFMALSYGHLSWEITKLLMAAVVTLALTAFFYTLAHYIAEELWLRKVKRTGVIEIDGNAP